MEGLQSDPTVLHLDWGGGYIHLRGSYNCVGLRHTHANEFLQSEWNLKAVCECANADAAVSVVVC